VDQGTGVSRLRLFRQVRDVLSESPMLLVLEDVHWADEATLDILRYLGRRLAGTELMILATFRSEELNRDHPLTVVLGDLATLPGVIRMQLPPLSATGVRQLLDAAGSDLDAGAIFERTGGNPFYVTEVLAAGADRVPATVRDAVLARVSRLSPAAQEVAGVTSVLGRRAEADFVAAVSGRPLAAVDECLDRGVLVIDGTTVGFRHDLARLASSSRFPRRSAPSPTPARLRSCWRRALMTTGGWRITPQAAGTARLWRAMLRSPPPGQRGSAHIAKPRSTSSWRCATTRRPIGTGPNCSTGCRMSVT
jgi:hypothetical protein